MDSYELRAQIAKGLAHPARMMIVDLLIEQELSVTEITEKVGLDQSTISKHLSTLKQAGLIKGKKQGNKIYYTTICKCLQDMFSCFERVLSINFEKFKTDCTQEIKPPKKKKQQH